MNYRHYVVSILLLISYSALTQCLDFYNNSQLYVLLVDHATQAVMVAPGVTITDVIKPGSTISFYVSSSSSAQQFMLTYQLKMIARVNTDIVIKYLDVVTGKLTQLYPKCFELIAQSRLQLLQKQAGKNVQNNNAAMTAQNGKQSVVHSAKTMTSSQDSQAQQSQDVVSSLIAQYAQLQQEQQSAIDIAMFKPRREPSTKSKSKLKSSTHKAKK
jgi:hypothetical protein